jgi:hypothetical protein
MTDNTKKEHLRRAATIVAVILSDMPKNKEKKPLSEKEQRFRQGLGMRLKVGDSDGKEQMK